MNPKGFFGELKRRNVYKVAVAYAIVGWLLIQIATQVFPFLEIPTWVVRLVIALVAIGFPVALIIAWAFEATPEGIRRTSVADAIPANRNKNRTWIYVAVVGAAFSIGLFFIGRYSAKPGTLRHSEATTASAIPAKSIAVLPFQNLSEEKANAYFAEGIQNEILTKLAMVRDLKVISRTSTVKYQSKPDNLKTVAQELGVASILEGAVQRGGNKVRVNVQLIDARTDTHLWAKSYDRDLQDVLRVESEVAGEIAEALKANLSPSETHVLAAPRTQNAEAYDLFLRGQFEFYRAENAPIADAYDRADSFYRQALARDPNFAEAAAGLAYSRLSRHWFVSSLAPAELYEVKSIIDRALTHSPDSPEAHTSLGVLYYWGHRQYEEALSEFDRALELQPNNALAQQFCGWVRRRLGQWERALADVKKAQELDPRDPQIPSSTAAIYATLRLWKDAEQAAMRSLTLDPHNTVGATVLAISRLNATGDVSSARRAFESFAPDFRLSTLSYQGDVTAVLGMRTYLDVVERRFDDAYQNFEKVMGTDEPERLQKLAGRAVIRLLEGQAEGA